MSRAPVVSDAIELWEFLAARALGRVVLSTALLGALGAVGGALSTAAAFVAFLVGATLTGGTFDGPPLEALVFIVPVMLAVGAALGVVCGPVAGWLFLRRVPLWRALLEPATAVVVGAALCGPTGHLGYAVASAVGGYWVAAARLGWSHRRAAPGAGRAACSSGSRAASGEALVTR